MKEWKTVILLTLLAVGFRALHYIAFEDLIVAGSDATEYIRLGKQFASGNVYGVLDTYWPPLYPLLIGLVTVFVDSLVLPAVIVSILAGSLVVPLTFWLARQSCGESTAVIASVIAIFFPALINSVFDLGSENVYLICVTAALITGWRALEKGALADYFLTGMFVSLAYLTRPEAFGYLIFFVLLIAAGGLWKRELVRGKTLFQTALLLLGFALLATPYLLYLRSETGKWTISGKVAKNFAAGAFDEESLERTRTGRGEDSESDEQSAKALAKNFARNLRQAQTALASLIPFFLVLLVGLGLFSERWSQERLFREGYLVAFCVITIAGYAASYVLERYLWVLLPVFFVWMARGVDHLKHWYEKSSDGWKFPLTSYLPSSKYATAFLLSCIYLYMFPVTFFVRSEKSAWQASAFSERDAGEWLNENTKPASTIFAFSSVPIFYSQRKGFWKETETADEVLSEIVAKKIDYVVDSERAYSKRHYLKGLTALLRNNPHFELIYETNEFPGNKISIYKSRQTTE